MPKQKNSPDEMDRMILLELRKYPPSSIREIGIRVDRSFVSVRQRMNWLEKNGYIVQAPGTPTGSPRSKILSEKGFLFLEDPHLVVQKQNAE